MECSKCGEQYSEERDACPNCGKNTAHTKAEGALTVGFTLVILAVVGYLTGIFSMNFAGIFIIAGMPMLAYSLSKYASIYQ